MGQITKEQDDVKVTVMELDDEKLNELYDWVDEIPLTRMKRNMTRDFSDGVMVAEILQHLVPKIVEIHNYTPANSITQKLSNWGTLKRKVFPKLLMHIHEATIRAIVNCKPNVVESVVWQLKHKINCYLTTKPKPSRIDMQPVIEAPIPDKPVMPIGDAASNKPPVKHAAAKPAVATTTKPTVAPTNAKFPVMHFGTYATTRVSALDDDKEQSLLAAQETVQILQAKVKRLEQLLNLKDLRIADQAKRIEEMEKPANKKKR